MKHIVRYQKRFTSGTLQGLTVDCRVDFPTEESAMYFASALNAPKLINEHTDVITGARWLLFGEPKIVSEFG